MQILNPGWLLILGLIPVLILIHSLKPRPRQVEVTNLFLWREVLREKKGGLRLESLIKSLPLLLQVLAVLLGGLALARPVWTYWAAITGDVVLVLDSSASMKTLTGSGVRFDRAREEALRIVDALPEKGRMLIIEAGKRPTVRSAFTGDRGRLKKIIEEIRPSDVPGQIDKALYLALSFVDQGRDDLVYLITDGAGGDFRKTIPLHQRVRPILVTGGEKNVGITGFEFRPEFARRDRYEILLEIRNFNPHPVLCPVHATLGEKRIVKQTLGLKAFEKKRLIFPYEGPLKGVAEAVLDLQDDFPVDNKAYNVLSATGDKRVLLVTKGNYFLQKILEAYPNFMVNTVEEIIPSSWADQTRRHDIVILDRISPPSTEEGNFLLIESYSPSIPIAKAGELDEIGALVWDRRHPLMANLDLTGIHLESASRIRADMDLRPLVEAGQNGLMYAYEKGGLRAVFLGFDITRSDLPLRVAYPVLMSNIIHWLSPADLRFSSLKTRSGDPFAIYLGADTKTLSIGLPSGKWERHRVEGSPYLYLDTGETGIYTVIEGERWRHFAVNLFDESESDIRVPPLETNDKESPEKKEAALAGASLPLWTFFILSTFAALILEWRLWVKGR